MKKTWDYALLSKAAKICGGPQNLAKYIYADGKREGMKKILPFLAVTVVYAIFSTIGNIKYKNAINKKENELQEDKTTYDIDIDSEEIIKSNGKGEYEYE